MAEMTCMGRGARPFYFMAVFWGAVYRGYFTDLLLASLLSPNNMPALRRERGSRFLIATTREDWEALQEAETFQLLEAYVEPVWLEIPRPALGEPKMLVMSRGHKLMAARAFDDRAYGVFLTPDLVLSDGSVAVLERLAETGTKVVLAVAIRFRHETMLAQMEREGYLKLGQPLTIRSRDLMRIGLENLHSETLRYEFDAAWFAETPVSVYWWVPGGEGMIIHSFSWAPLVVDYAALARHDTKTFEHWTLDGDYIHRNFPHPADVYVVTDSDEVALVSFTKEADLHFELDRRFAGLAAGVARWSKLRLIRLLKDSTVIDPLKRQIFATPVRLHAGEISAAWERTGRRVARLIRRACQPPRFGEDLAALIVTWMAPGLRARLLGNVERGEASTIVWLWAYRRFVWQRLKEKTGLAASRSRLNDRDWVSPTLSWLHPVWSVRAILREESYRNAAKGYLAQWTPFREILTAKWLWRYRRFVWQRLKEKAGLAAGRSRADDWISPTAEAAGDDPMYLMAGYTETLVEHPMDRARGIDARGSTCGLFKEDRDIGFYWFARNGAVVHASTFHLNNVGLISRNDYARDREPGEYRIVVLGDEMTAATTADVSWPDWLQDELNGNGTLLRRLGSQKFSVLNFGWPDAGFPHFAQVWRDKARAFAPDLVIINLVAHDFARYETGARIVFRGREPVEWRAEYACYKSPAGLEAWLPLVCVGDGRDLASLECTCGRPFALYLPKELAENPQELAAVQEQVVRDYASIADLRMRDFEAQGGTALTETDITEHARKQLHTILDDHPNVVITQSPSPSEALYSWTSSPMPQALMAADPTIQVVDMRAYLPRGARRREICSWYQFPHAAEKWSNTGHRVYAKAQARLIAGFLTARR